MLVKDNSIIEINNNFLDPVLSPPIPIVPSWATIAKVGLNDLIIDRQEYVEINVPYVQTKLSTGLICAYLEIPIPNDRLNDKYVVLEFNFKPFASATYRPASTSLDLYYWINLNRWNRKYNSTTSTYPPTQYYKVYSYKLTSHIDSSFTSGSYYIPNQTTTTISDESSSASFTLTANRVCDTGINVRILFDDYEHKAYILYSTSSLPSEIVKSDMSLIDYSWQINPEQGNTSYMLNIVSELPWYNTVYNNTTYKFDSGLAFDSPAIDSNIVIKSYNGETLE